MAIGAGIAAAASAAMSGLSAYGSGKLANVQNKYSAKTNELNAKLAEQQAQSALRKGEKEQQMVMTKGAKLKGQQKVAYGANGIDLSSRSAQNVLNETDYFTEADRLQVAANSIAEAWNARLQSAQYKGQALVDRSKVQNPLRGAILAGLASGLSTYAAAGGFNSSPASKTTWTQESGYVTRGTETGTASFKLNRVGTGNVNMLAGASPSSSIGMPTAPAYQSGYMNDWYNRGWSD